MVTETDSVILETILEKLTLLEQSIKVLNAENTKRTEEISMIARHSNLIETENESRKIKSKQIQRKLTFHI